MNQLIDVVYLIGVGFVVGVGYAVGNGLTRWFCGVIKQLVSKERGNA